MTDHQIRLICAIAFIFVLLLYIWYCDQRAKMTPEERKAEDDELRNDPHSLVALKF